MAGDLQFFLPQIAMRNRNPEQLFCTKAPKTGKLSFGLGSTCLL
ncbi:hypothetical protein HMPREF1986_02838 [Oribacterium sp. oral taxon 078 str. F0263]|nr:hypothetical protein HMPREF1986_02838 [Oribacterium sp. oral taxon 078 str. F0263]